MTSLLPWTAWTGRRKSLRHRNRLCRPRLMLEGLEDRCLLAVVSLIPIKDTTLIRDTTTALGSTSNGAGDIFVGLNKSLNRTKRGLLEFDVAGSVPAGATINSATLTMWVNRNQSRTTMDVELHNVLAEWGEAGSVGSGDGGPAETGDATWLHTFYPNQRWANQGGDFTSTASGVRSIGLANASYTWASTTQMVADVQSWLDHADTNHGWLLKGDENSRSSHRFDSRDSATAAHRPTLTIDYTPAASVPKISISDVSFAEGQAGAVNASFDVTLSAASAQTITVNYATADGTAVAGTDYQASSGTLTFSPGQTLKTITVPANGDSLVELNEAFAVNLAEVQNATLLDSQGTATITNDDDASLAIGDVSLVEGHSGTTDLAFTVTLGAAVDTPVTVNYSTANGTATTADGDFSAVSGTLTFAGSAGETKTITVHVGGDRKVELDETILVNLSNLAASGRNVTLADQQAQGTITNDDQASFSIGDVSRAEGNSGTTNLTFTVTLESPVDAPVTVSYATADGTGTTADNDYTPTSGTLSFSGSAGETRTLSVGVNGDRTPEIDETLVVGLSNVVAQGRNVVIADGLGLGTIINDDAGLRSLTLDPARDNTLIENATGSVSNGGGDIFVGQNSNGNLVRRGLLAFDVAGSIPAGATIQSVALTMFVVQTQVGDRPVELHEVLADWGEAGATGAGTGGTSQPGDATWLHTFFDTQRWASSGGDFASVASAVATVGISDAFYTWNSTPRMVADVQTWLDQPAKNYGWLLKTDEAQSSAKRFASRESENASLRPKLTIQFTEAPPPEISVNDVVLLEGNSGSTTAQFNLTLSAPGSQPITVDFETADGSALSANDYSSTAGTITFAPGEVSKTIQVNVNGDLLVEAQETFFLNLRNAVNASLADGQGAATITNDDRATLSVTNMNLAEGNAGLTAFVFNVTLDAAVDVPVNIAYSTVDGSATVADGDYTSASGTLSFAGNSGESKTISVQVKGDQKLEPDETFFLELASVLTTGRDVAIASRGQGTITNDDPLVPPGLSIGDARLTEGNQGTRQFTFAVTLNAATPGPVSVDFGTADGTAQAANPVAGDSDDDDDDDDHDDHDDDENQEGRRRGDYLSASGTLHFAGEAGETQTITVLVNGDRELEPDEAYFVNLTNAVGAAIVDAQGVGTIVDDDRPASSVALRDGVLRIIGTEKGDRLSLRTASRGELLVTASFLSNRGGLRFKASDVARIEIQLLGGNDLADIDRKLLVPVVLDGGVGDDILRGGGGKTMLVGGDGNDLLYGGLGYSILIGGAGNDRLSGGSARSILIGGTGQDILRGSSADDILIGGQTAFDATEAAMWAILDEWTSTRSLLTRINNLTTGIGPGKTYKLDAGTLLDDSALDVLFGKSGSDWFLSLGDTIADRDHRDR